ncbi:two-component system response regulator [candidate division TA06 bacterium]|uniref:Two-component system response regulator n=1 Tax=candidate division TA06 bacterium TaxID=2250710 RepID=A0A660SDW6_UNCT6|nr:MAG: two-component system response regulator [candidate division TA06 bacterium]
MKVSKVLIVEDERVQRISLENYLKTIGYNAKAAANFSEAINLIDHFLPDIVISDLKLGEKSGLELFKKYGKGNNIPFIIITAFGTIESAVESIKMGVFNYISKPINLDELRINIEKALSFYKLKDENIKLKNYITNKDNNFNFIYKSSTMKKLVLTANKAAKSSAPILIEGETGTGKEVLARYIHNLSPRANQLFIGINIGAFNRNLLEDELFGHIKGAFTGAFKERKGLFSIASGGTLFLDEIGEMPLDLQVKLLRVLQEKEFMPLGSSKQDKTDVRIITATNKDIKDMIRNGIFREDLYFRLNVLKLHIPPLRERREDIKPLMNYFIEKYSFLENKRIKDFNVRKNLLLSYPFPGNIRELENIIHRGIILSEDNILNCEIGEIMEETLTSNENGTLKQIVAVIETKHIRKALEQSKGIKTKAAKLLGINERILRYKMEKYNIK